MCFKPVSDCLLESLFVSWSLCLILFQDNDLLEPILESTYRQRKSVTKRKREKRDTTTETTANSKCLASRNKALRLGLHLVVALVNKIQLRVDLELPLPVDSVLPPLLALLVRYNATFPVFYLFRMTLIFALLHRFTLRHLWIQRSRSSFWKWWRVRYAGSSFWVWWRRDDFRFGASCPDLW